ncbi:hypothetical protein IWQ62_003096 [Dispira parvispora]|uniref:Mediator of RNA polymerase II transcription subunit 18 n=1 Tax=Dispira parvispora TaxID=1520584 RepID=A0A9W8E379_9FUNG|nr:hypothetical protein IWQ62_003096 [Dispira parvispora]
MALATLYGCSLYGLVSDHQKPLLLDRLAGLCGGRELCQPLLRHTLGYIPAVETPLGPARNNDVVLRLQSDIDPQTSDPNRLDNREWVLCQLGHPDPHMSTVVDTRPELHASLGGGDVLKFMTLLGYRYTFEFAQEGHIFIYQDRIRIQVTRVYELLQQHDLLTRQPKLPDGAWLVEVAIHGVPRDQVTRVPEELMHFKALLEGVVKLENVDYLYLQNQIRYQT